MYKPLIFIVLLIPLLASSALAQSAIWDVQHDIKRDNYLLLKGTVGEYPITMYLETGGSCGSKGTALQWKSRIYKGWYHYDKVQTKIPLIGAINYSAGRSYVNLFVPNNFTDTLNTQTCKPTEYQEVFRNPSGSELTSMQWKKVEGGSSLPVSLEVIHPNNYETTAYLQMTRDGIALRNFDLSETTGLKYIDFIQDLDFKVSDKDLHLTFKFGERTNPGSSGGGECGMGVETYLGYLHYNEHLSVVQFTHKRIHSCCCSAENYKVEKGAPEKGLLKKP